MKGTNIGLSLWNVGYKVNIMPSKISTFDLYVPLLINKVYTSLTAISNGSTQHMQLTISCYTKKTTNRRVMSNLCHWVRFKRRNKTWASFDILSICLLNKQLTCANWFADKMPTLDNNIQNFPGIVRQFYFSCRF